MGHMQPDYGPVTDNTHPTDGGTRTIITGNEWPYISEQHQGMACVRAELGEGEDHTQGEYAGKTHY